MPIDDALNELKIKEEIEKLKHDKQLAQEKAEKKQKEIIKLNEELDKYKQRLDDIYHETQYKTIRAHLRGLLNFWPEKNPKDEVEEAIIKLVTHVDFVEIYRNTLVIKDLLKRREYIMMKGLELEILNTFMDDSKLFFKLSPLGLTLTCPYFKYDKSEKNNFDKCLIEEGKEIDATCHGRYDICVIFKDKTPKFITGEIPYVAPKRTYNAPELNLTEIERESLENRLLLEIEKFWRDDE